MPYRIAILVALLGSICAGAEDYATHMTLATIKVFNRDSTATGFFIRPPKAQPDDKRLILVTAAHVFEKMSGDKAILVYRKAKDDGDYQRLDHEVTIRKNGNPLWIKHPDADVAIFVTEPPDDAIVHPIDFACLVDEATLKESGLHIGSELLSLGYPTRVEANSSGFAICRHGSIASFPLWPIKNHSRFLIDAISFEGESGGPVFVADPREKNAATDEAPPLVLGIVVAQISHVETSNRFYEEDKIRYPLHLSEVLQAQFVRETIAKLEKPPTTAPATRTAPAIGE